MDDCPHGGMHQDLMYVYPSQEGNNKKRGLASQPGDEDEGTKEGLPAPLSRSFILQLSHTTSFLVVSLLLIW